MAFSNDSGIYVIPPGGSPRLLPNTAGMIYPSWYPHCQRLAADVTGTQVSAEIDAATGATIVSPLANETVWAGFPSVNQTDPNLIAFAGQFNKESNYYDEDLNYIWVADRSTRPPLVEPMDRAAPKGPAFPQKFQARAGWWSPDGKWFAFESNRTCNQSDRWSDLRHLHSGFGGPQTGDASHRLPMECAASEVVSARNDG